MCRPLQNAEQCHPSGHHHQVGGGGEGDNLTNTILPTRPPNYPTLVTMCNPVVIFDPPFVQVWSDMQQLEPRKAAKSEPTLRCKKRCQTQALGLTVAPTPSKSSQNKGGETQIEKCIRVIL